VHRRAGVRSGLLLLAALLVVGVVALAPRLPVHASTDPQPPPVTSNDFLPQERDLSECVGALERPGCGSEARGGWHQTLVFVAVAGGLAVVFGRIAWAARRNRSRV
jgi:hypothetical protein